MTKIINGENAVLGRLASYAAKEALKGEEIVIVNSEEIIITGNKQNITANYVQKRGRVGTSQKGPKHSKLVERVVKRTVRGMLPNHRSGRGKDALRRIKCYRGIPKEFEKMKMISFGKDKFNKYVKVGDISK